jgi:ankyrin repeat protein
MKKKPNAQQIYQAIRRRDVELLRKLLTEGADPKACVRDAYHGNSPVLLHAASFQFLEGVKLLLDAGADPNALMSGGEGAMGGQTPLHHAIGDEGFAIVDLLLKAGANPNAVDENRHYTPLCTAASSGYFEIAQRLIEAGATFKTWPPGCDPPLVAACVGVPPHGVEEGRKQELIAKLLLDLGAPVDGETANGLTALIGAAINASERLVNLLLEHGANVNHRSQNGRTPLICAAGYARWATAEDKYQLAFRIVKRLLEAGADPKAQNEEGETAMDIAARGKGTLAANLLADFERKLEALP